MNYIVQVRFGDEANWVTSFIQPNAPAVLALVREKPVDVDPVSYFSRWIWANVNYPTSPLAPDFHKLEGFRKAGWLAPAAIKLSTADFWQFPSETLGWSDAWGRHWGDCEDSSAVLCSLLRNYLPPEDVYVAVGNVSIFPHAWLKVRHLGAWGLIETTTPHNRLLPEAQPYAVKAIFNDRYAVELEPGFYSRLGAFAGESRREHKAKMGVICPFLEQCGSRS